MGRRRLGRLLLEAAVVRVRRLRSPTSINALNSKSQKGARAALASQGRRGLDRPYWLSLMLSVGAVSVVCMSITTLLVGLMK